MAAALMGGCAHLLSYQKNDAGQEVVWIHSIHWERSSSSASGAGAGFSHAAGMFGVGLAAHIAADLVGRGVSKVVDKAEVPGKVLISFYPDVPRPFMVGGAIGWRDAWPGAEQLLPKTWAILSRDEKGMILLPCPEECAPSKKKAAASAGE